jgi:Cytochrome P460
MNLKPLMTGTALSLGLQALAGAAEGPAYPEGYRYWSHVKSMTIHPGHALADPFLGIHHIYANPQALEGLSSGRFPDGSIIVFDQLQYLTANNASVEGERVLVGVMEKDAKHFADTGGWGYQGWAGNNRDQALVTDGGAACFACHAQQAGRDYVFSQWRE